MRAIDFPIHSLTWRWRTSITHRSGSNGGEAHIQGRDKSRLKIRATVGKGDNARFIYEVMYA